MTDNTYNGWANYETWNAALWIGNDEGLYDEARRIARGSIHPYADFVDMMENVYGMSTTGDGVRWDSSLIDVQEMDEMMEEMVS